MDEPCLEWTGSRQGSGKGYGRLRRAQQTQGESYVHRHVWAEVHGPIPKGVEIMHICDNTLCYRLSHLRLGSHRENMRDASTKGRHASRVHPELRQGVNNGQAIVTDEIVREIRRRYVPGTGQANRGNSAALAAEFGIARCLVTKIARRGCWQHVRD